MSYQKSAWWFKSVAVFKLTFFKTPHPFWRNMYLYRKFWLIFLTFWKLILNWKLWERMNTFPSRMLLKAFTPVSNYHFSRAIIPYLKESVVWFYYYWWMLPFLIQIINFQWKLFLSKDDPSSFIIIKWDSYLILSVLHMSLVQCEVFVKCLFLTIYAR